MRKRCVNLDWLECSCYESADEPRTSDWFIEHNIPIDVREYGTRVYLEMFTILDNHGNPFLEVRRGPVSPILNPRACSLRLVNAYCYVDNAATLMADFIRDFDYEFLRISRVDICLDFTSFDYGDDPARFVQRYIAGKFSKINQSNLHAHGVDTWTSRDFNSLSWGASTSEVSTKMYDKTLELFDAHSKKFKKPHIRLAWLSAGIIDDWEKCTLNGEPVRVWRVEFSIRAGSHGWFKIELNGKSRNYQSIRNTLDMYNSRAKLITLFASLQHHYFHFKYFVKDKRKDRCKDKRLFDFTSEQQMYKLNRDMIVSVNKKQNPVASLISRLQSYRDSKFDADTIRACDVLLRILRQESLSFETGLFTRAEIEAFSFAVQLSRQGRQSQFSVLCSEIAEFLKLNPNTLPF